MTELTNLIDRFEQLRGQEEVDLVDLRRLILEVEDLLNSEAYNAMSVGERSEVQNLRKELKSQLRAREEGSNGDGQSPAPTPAAPQENAGPVSGTPAAEVREHNPMAEQQMEAAERLFCCGRYAEASNLFDRVLQLEPGWERARQHRAESENYLRTGYIPAVALPSDAASAYGKAQAAARVGRYADALALLEKAQEVMRELGIQRWQEG